MEKTKEKDSGGGFLEEHANEGFENVQATDVTIPFLRILQLLSPQVIEDSEEYVEGARPGAFINTVTNKLYGMSIRVIPLTFKKIWLEWQPDRGGLVGRHEPYSIPVDKTKFSEWTYDGNVIQETLLFYVLIEGHFPDGPLVFALQSSGIKHGKNWNTQIMMTKLPSGARAPYYSSVWELVSIKNENNQGVWWQIGSKKSNIKRLRFIDKKEFDEFVFPVKEALISAQELDFKQIEDQKEVEEKVPF